MESQGESMKKLH